VKTPSSTFLVIPLFLIQGMQGSNLNEVQYFQVSTIGLCAVRATIAFGVYKIAILMNCNRNLSRLKSQVLSAKIASSLGYNRKFAWLNLQNILAEFAKNILAEFASSIGCCALAHSAVFCANESELIPILRKNDNTQ
jgi:hypothetical protein